MLLEGHRSVAFALRGSKIAYKWRSLIYIFRHYLARLSVTYFKRPEISLAHQQLFVVFFYNVSFKGRGNLCRRLRKDTKSLVASTYWKQVNTLQGAGVLCSVAESASYKS